MESPNDENEKRTFETLHQQEQMNQTRLFE